MQWIFRLTKKLQNEIFVSASLLSVDFRLSLEIFTQKFHIEKIVTMLPNAILNVHSADIYRRSRMLIVVSRTEDGKNLKKYYAKCFISCRCCKVIPSFHFLPSLLAPDRRTSSTHPPTLMLFSFLFLFLVYNFKLCSASLSTLGVVNTQNSSNEQRQHRSDTETE